MRMTIEKRIAELLKPAPDMSTQVELLRELPGDMEYPTLSNFRDDPDDGINGWVSFSSPSYDPDNLYDAAGVFLALESAGWELLPATLVKWDNYRPSTFQGLFGETPETKGRYTMTEEWVIAPLWGEPCTHTAPEVCCYMRTLAGLVVKVSVDVPGSRMRLTARRNKRMGSWSYERGTARLEFPNDWHSIMQEDECIAVIGSRTGAQVDTEQGLSGRVYWEPCGLQGQWPMSASAFVSQLLSAS